MFPSKGKVRRTEFTRDKLQTNLFILLLCLSKLTQHPFVLFFLASLWLALQ